MEHLVIIPMRDIITPDGDEPLPPTLPLNLMNPFLLAAFNDLYQKHTYTLTDQQARGILTWMARAISPQTVEPVSPSLLGFVVRLFDRLMQWVHRYRSTHLSDFSIGYRGTTRHDLIVSFDSP